MRSRKVTAGVAVAAVGAIALLAAVAAMSAGARTSAAPVGSGKASATKAVCGMGTGKKATGAPIKIGALNMLIPGVDFTTVAKLAAAYFQCVNDNGGINGRPIQYIQYTEDLNPTHEAALARKLVESDKVVGIVGNTSFGECGTNWKYYKSKGFIVLGAGVQAECYSTPSYAEVNMGPRYSNMNAAQYLIAHGAKSIVIASPSTLSPYADGFLPKMAKQAGISYKIYPTVLPVTDANSQLTSMIQAAGDDGAIILDFTPDTAPAFLQAAISQGVVDKVMWGSSTPIANTAMAGQFGAFDNKIFINQELANLDSTGPGRDALPAGQREVHAQDRDPGVRAVRLPRREGGRRGAPQHQGRDHPDVVQRRREGARRPEDRHALQAVLRREHPLPHPEQRRHHRDLQRREGDAGPGVQGSADERRPADRPDAGLGEEVQAGRLGDARAGW